MAGKKTDGYRIAELRKAHGWSQGEFAARCMRPQSQIANWENGMTDPSLSNAVAMCKTLDVGVSQLVGDCEGTRERERERVGILWWDLPKRERDAVEALILSLHGSM